MGCSSSRAAPVVQRSTSCQIATLSKELGWADSDENSPDAAKASRGAGWKRNTHVEEEVLTKEQRSHAASRGVDLSLINPKVEAYFADVRMLKYFRETAPELLLLPWEYMRMMGVLQLRKPARTDYTFMSHQWQEVAHPFPDLVQLTEHLDGVSSRFLWLDWYSVPQWVRSTSAVACNVFDATMLSFHALCFNASDALIVLKRRDHGLTMGEDDLGALLHKEAEATQRAIESAGLVMRSSLPTLVSIVERIQSIGVDLEYAVRAWCALEKTYLPDSFHKDVRLMRLIAFVTELRVVCGDYVDAFNSLRGRVSYAVDNQAPSRLLVHIERIDSIIALCQASSKTRRIYQNVWSYHYLKNRVLRITDPNDYVYLDRLFGNNRSLDENAVLYLRSVQTERRLVITDVVVEAVYAAEESRDSISSPESAPSVGLRPRLTLQAAASPKRQWQRAAQLLERERRQVLEGENAKWWDARLASADTPVSLFDLVHGFVGGDTFLDVSPSMDRHSRIPKAEPSVSAGDSRPDTRSWPSAPSCGSAPNCSGADRPARKSGLKSSLKGGRARSRIAQSTEVEPAGRRPPSGRPDAVALLSEVLTETADAVITSLSSRPPSSGGAEGAVISSPTFDSSEEDEKVGHRRQDRLSSPCSHARRRSSAVSAAEPSGARPSHWRGAPLGDFGSQPSSSTLSHNTGGSFNLSRLPSTAALSKEASGSFPATLKSSQRTSRKSVFFSLAPERSRSVFLERSRSDGLPAQAAMSRSISFVGIRSLSTTARRAPSSERSSNSPDSARRGFIRRMSPMRRSSESDGPRRSVRRLKSVAAFSKFGGTSTSLAQVSTALSSYRVSLAQPGLLDMESTMRGVRRREIERLDPGMTIVRFEGKLLIHIVNVDEARRELRLHISDMGVLGAHPMFDKLLVVWKGSLADVQSFQVHVISSRRLTFQDLAQHTVAQCLSTGRQRTLGRVRGSNNSMRRVRSTKSERQQRTERTEFCESSDSHRSRPRDFR